MSEDLGGAHELFLRSRPARAGLQALAESIEGPGATVVGVRRLTGGLEASTHRVTIALASGTRRAVVVRRFNRRAQWYDDERLPREAAVLASLAGTGVPAPACLVVDVEGRWLGTPLLVLSCLPGGPAPPGQWVPWAGRLVDAMASLHSVPAVIEPEPWLVGWRTGTPPASLVDDPWLERVWPVISACRAELSSSGGGRLSLVHHDLHPGNTLWSRGRVSGIVDWPLAGAGWPAYDRAYLRLDVSICHGLDAGDAFRIGAAVDDHPAWDLIVGLRALPNPDLWVGVYNEIGVAMTPAEGRDRLAAWFERALAQLG